MQATDATESASTYYETDGRSLVSPDGHATLIPILLAHPGEDHIETRRRTSGPAVSEYTTALICYLVRRS